MHCKLITDQYEMQLGQFLDCIKARAPRRKVSEKSSEKVQRGWGAGAKKSGGLRRHRRIFPPSTNLHSSVWDHGQPSSLPIWFHFSIVQPDMKILFHITFNSWGAGTAPVESAVLLCLVRLTLGVGFLPKTWLYICLTVVTLVIGQHQPTANRKHSSFELDSPRSSDASRFEIAIFQVSKNNKILKQIFLISNFLLLFWFFAVSKFVKDKTCCTCCTFELSSIPPIRIIFNRMFLCNFSNKFLAKSAKLFLNKLQRESPAVNLYFKIFDIKCHLCLQNANWGNWTQN